MNETEELKREKEYISTEKHEISKSSEQKHNDNQ